MGINVSKGKPQSPSSSPHSIHSPKEKEGRGEGKYGRLQRIQVNGAGNSTKKQDIHPRDADKHGAAELFLPGGKGNDLRLESIASEYMKRSSLRRSQNKFGVDLKSGDFAEDRPLDSPKSPPPPNHFDHHYENLSSQTEEDRLIEEELGKDSPPIRWQKGGPLGQGAYGTVCLGLDMDTGEMLAVKQIPLTLGGAKSEVKTFEGEVALMKNLEHENIVRYIGTSVDEGMLNIFMEYVPGGSICSILAKFGCLSEAVIAKYTRQILLGLDYLHIHNIIHRDVKGANVLVTDKGEVKLSDFGASKRLEGIVMKSIGDGLLSSTQFTDSDQKGPGCGSEFRSLKGTPNFMAPEVIKQEGYGRQADIWSLGATVYEMFSGRPPYSECKDSVAAMFQVASGAIPPPSIPKGTTHSPEAAHFLALCFRRDPKERPTPSGLLNHAWINAHHSTVHHDNFGRRRSTPSLNNPEIRTSRDRIQHPSHFPKRRSSDSIRQNGIAVSSSKSFQNNRWLTKRGDYFIPRTESSDKINPMEMMEEEGDFKNSLSSSLGEQLVTNAPNSGTKRSQFGTEAGADEQSINRFLLMSRRQSTRNAVRGPILQSIKSFSSIRSAGLSVRSEDSDSDRPITRDIGSRGSCFNYYTDEVIGALLEKAEEARVTALNSSKDSLIQFPNC